jgi:hypothetical protein
MAVLAPDFNSALAVVVGTTGVEFGATMAPLETWLFSSNTNCWIKQGAHAALVTTPAVAGAAGNVYVAAGVMLPIDGREGADLSVVQDAAGGKASLCRAMTK